MFPAVFTVFIHFSGGRACIKDYVFIDPFSGSGTTAASAAKHNRRWIGIDISEEYCELATARLKIAQAEVEEDDERDD